MSFVTAATVAGISAGVSAIGGTIGALSARKKQKRAERKARKERKEMNRLKNIYSELDTSNPFLNMQNQFTSLENTMEDLTVNQQQAQFEAQQFQQSQANILGDLRGAAGGSGVAALAQQMAQSGQLAAQRSSASIGQQEAANQMAAARQAGALQQMEAQEGSRIQTMQAQGEQISRNWERDKQATLLGMSQQKLAAHRDQAAMAEQAKWGAISSGIQGVTSAAGSYLGTLGD